jgi:hypothetical protein
LPLHQICTTSDGQTRSFAVTRGQALTRVWERIAHTFDKASARAIETELNRLAKAAKNEDVAKAADAATRLNQSHLLSSTTQ